MSRYVGIEWNADIGAVTGFDPYGNLVISNGRNMYMSHHPMAPRPGHHPMAPHPIAHSPRIGYDSNGKRYAVIDVPTGYIMNHGPSLPYCVEPIRRGPTHTRNGYKIIYHDNYVVINGRVVVTGHNYSLFEQFEHGRYILNYKMSDGSIGSIGCV